MILLISFIYITLNESYRLEFNFELDQKFFQYFINQYILMLIDNNEG